MLLLIAFSVLAPLLACVGIYGVISYSIAQRVPEIGIRMALGAVRWHVLQMMLRERLRMAAVGGAIGACGAGLVAKLFAELLAPFVRCPRNRSVDVADLFLCLMLAVLSACLIAASRAAGLDPMNALHHQ